MAVDSCNFTLFLRLRPVSHPSGHYPKLMTAGQRANSHEVISGVTVFSCSYAIYGTRLAECWGVRHERSVSNNKLAVHTGIILY